MLLISIGLFVSYLIMVTVIYGKLPPSISEGYYILRSKGEKYSTIFFPFMVGIGLSFIIYGLEYYGGLPYSFLFFLSGGGLCFVGAASQFKETFVRKVHIWAALICAVSIILWVVIYGNLFLLINLLILFSLIAIIDKKKGRFTLWAELFAFVNAYLQLNILK